MFEQLFGSKTRVKLLKLFYNNTSRSFYVREITRKINEQINSVRRELANLISVGVVKSKGENNRLYYYLNQNFEFDTDFKNIFTKSKAENSDEHKYGKKIRQIGRVYYAHLSGFFASDFTSPVDVLIVGDVNHTKLEELVAELSGENHREINFTAMTLEDFNYRMMLYDRFMTEVMAGPKIVLVDELPKEVKIDSSEKEIESAESDEEVKSESESVI